MKSFFSDIISGLVLWLLRRYRTLSVELLKLRAVIWYVQGVRTARKLFLSFMSLALCLMLAGGGFILLHVGLYKVLPPPANALTLLILGAIYMIVAMAVLCVACSERTWMKASCAAEFTELVTKKEDLS